MTKNVENALLFW